MICHFRNLPELKSHEFCVVGAGPAGIALSTALARSGHSVLLIESGTEKPSSATQALSKATITNPASHAPVEIGSCRALGGTSWWWGGRCLPFDEVDFSPREFAPGTDWPLSYEEIEVWHPSAAEFLKCGHNFFSPPNSPTLREEKLLCSLERWSPETNLGHAYKHGLHSSRLITVLLGASVSQIHLSASQTSVAALTVSDGERWATYNVPNCILACGGLESTRLLLCTAKKYPPLFEGAHSVLGRGYMGHISGKIADIVLNDPSMIEDFDFFQDGSAYVRRRLTLDTQTMRDARVLNIAMWIDNPPFHDHQHRNAILSAVWLLLSIPAVGRRLIAEGVRLAHLGPKPYQFAKHITNLFRSPISTLKASAALIFERFLARPRKPGFIVRNAAGRYALHYHAEQLPRADSVIRLSEEADLTGMPRLTIDLKFSTEDAASVIRAHDLIDQQLRRVGVGRLEYRMSRDLLHQSVLSQASDGFHQLGTTRMSADPSKGIVDENLKVHGFSNLHVLSTSTFPSSGQANPTFLVVALAFRLASHLASARLSFT